MHYISGKIWTDGGFKKGHIGFQDGLVTEVGDGEVKDPIAKGLILPTFVNAHTHIADYVVPIDLSLSLADIVRPPDGLKYKILAETPAEIQRNAMVKMSAFMFRRAILPVHRFSRRRCRGFRSPFYGDGRRSSDHYGETQKALFRQG